VGFRNPTLLKWRVSLAAHAKIQRDRLAIPTDIVGKGLPTYDTSSGRARACWRKRTGVAARYPEKGGPEAAFFMCAGFGLVHVRRSSVVDATDGSLAELEEHIGVVEHAVE
jgi:hypothetical protein